MKNLFRCELKKFFHSSMRRVLILMLMMLPIILFLIFQKSDQQQQVIFDGKVVSLSTSKVLADDFRTSVAGEIDESWLVHMETLLNECKESGLSPNDVKYQTISDAYWSGLHAYETRLINLNSITTPDIIKDDISEQALRYGPYEGWLSYMTAFKCCALAYIICCLFLFSDLFNQEDYMGTTDLIKSSRYGGMRLAFIKLVVACVITFILGILLYGILRISFHSVLTSLGNQTTVLMFKGSFQIYNFNSINTQAFILTLLGGLICSIVASFNSVLVKKPFVSLGGSLFFYLFPSFITLTAFNTSWSSFFPSSFLNFHALKQLLNISWVQIDYLVLHRIVAIGSIWCITVILLVIGIFWLHNPHKRHYLIKNWRKI